MADVIFNGSSARMPVGQASTELVFDNSDGTLSGPYAAYSEVAIRRVVARDGTSQYFLNNTRCRRKDITHILLGTGLGAHGYSIIEQGMISRLVEAKPEEIRAFLEEAAGISKYKERRLETERRIRRTRENLDRLRDLREEVDKQLGHLQRQARAASRYKKLMAEQRQIGAELLALRLLGLKAEVHDEESKRNEKQTVLDAAIAEQRSTETRIEKLRVEHSVQSDNFNSVQGKYYKVGAEIARLEQSIQHRKELSQRQKEDLKVTDDQLGEIRAHIESDQVEIEEIDRLLRELSPGLEGAHLSHQTSLDALRQVEEASEFLLAPCFHNQPISCETTYESRRDDADADEGHERKEQKLFVLPEHHDGGLGDVPGTREGSEDSTHSVVILASEGTDRYDRTLQL